MRSSTVLRLGISTCPNDTFIFAPLILGFVKPDGLSLKFFMEDVETLNSMVLEGGLDASKVSVAVLPKILASYELLSCGGALAFQGPVVVSRKKDISIDPGASVALPGENTTAHLLFSIFHPDLKNKVFTRFDKVSSMVIEGKVDLGVLIHEGRFTCRDMGLEIVEDLGELWHSKTDLPIPLGVIVLKRRFSHLRDTLESCIREGLTFSMNNPSKVMPFVKEYARDMSDDVIRKHIEAYVNDFTFNIGELGRRAISKILLYNRTGLW